MGRIIIASEVIASLEQLRLAGKLQPLDTLGLPAIVPPLRPRRPERGWQLFETGPRLMACFRKGAVPYAIEDWYNRGHEVRALTAVERVAGEGVEPRLEYHISFSGLKWQATKHYRISESRARWALDQFGADGFLEDNHVPGGTVRNFFRPLNDLEVGKVCECVDQEHAVREMKGDYIWRGYKP